MQIQRIYGGCETPYVFDNDVGAHLNGSVALTTTLCCGFVWRRQTEFDATSTNLANKSSCNMVRTDTYAHPQNMKDTKHHICVWHWCEHPFEWVYSLNYHTTLLLDPEDVNRIPGNSHKLGQWEEQQHCKDRYIYPSTAWKVCVAH